MNTLSTQRPFPSMLVRMPPSLSTSVKASPVNWHLWSVLTLSGVLSLHLASRSAATPKSVSSVLDSGRRAPLHQVRVRFFVPTAIGLKQPTKHKKKRQTSAQVQFV